MTTDGDDRKADRKAAIFEAACRWAEGDGYAILGDRFEFSELNVYRFVGDPRDILVDAYIALVGLTPTQLDGRATLGGRRTGKSSKMIDALLDRAKDRGVEVRLIEPTQPDRQELSDAIGYAYNNEFMDPAGHAADAVLALFNGGTK